MPPKTISTVTGIRKLVACDNCGKLKEHTKRVNLSCPHRERLSKGQGKLVCLMSYVLFFTGWAFDPACFVVILDASCLMRINLSCIQDTADTRVMQPCVEHSLEPT